jgi:hypothetical protein
MFDAAFEGWTQIARELVDYDAIKKSRLDFGGSRFEK